MEQYTHDGDVEKSSKEFMEKDGYIKKRDHNNHRRWNNRDESIKFNGTTYTPPQDQYERHNQ